MNDFWSAISKNGFTTVALVVVCYGFWKFIVEKVWVQLTGQMERSEKRLDEATKAFVEELKQQRLATKDGFDDLAKAITERLDRLDRPHK